MAVMRSQGDDCNVDFGIVDFVNHAILLVDAARPCFLKGIVPQMFHLTGACARMLLKFHEHAGNLFECGFVATLFDDCKLGFGSLRKKYGVGHGLQRIDEGCDVVFGFQAREFCSWAMGFVDVVLHSFHVARIGKEVIARWTDVVGINLVRRFCQLAYQPVAVFLGEREALD